MKCECPIEGFVPQENYYRYEPEEYLGMNHKPNECPGTYLLSVYRREGKEIILCSCCWLDIDDFIREV